MNDDMPVEKLRKALRTNGFAKVLNFATAEEVSTLIAVLEKMIDLEIGWRRSDQCFFERDGGSDVLSMVRIPSPLSVLPELRSLGLFSRAEQLAEDALQGKVRHKAEHFIHKPPFVGCGTPLHQDPAYGDPGKRYRNLNVWVSLDAATIESGCLQYVPGSHKLGLLPHKTVVEGTQSGLEVTSAERFRDKLIPVMTGPGDAVLHQSYVLHSAGSNTSAIPRRAFIMIFEEVR